MVFAGGCGFGLLPGLELRLDLLGVLVHVFLSAELSDLADEMVGERPHLLMGDLVLPFDGMT